jgi:hypothetical protein
MGKEGKAFAEPIAYNRFLGNLSIAIVKTLY